MKASLKSQSHVTIGLCGGSTPIPIYEALSHEGGIDWKQITFVALDERYVPASNNDSNQGMMHRRLANALSQGAMLLAPDTGKPLQECIEAYEHAISGITLDLTIVGMGDDGHITSLFPPLNPEAFGPKLVIHTTTDCFAVHDRISTTLPFLTRGKEALFLITGQKKMDLLKTMQRESIDPCQYPAQALFGDQTTWMVGVRG